MSNRFHNKWHRKNHHTYGNITNPDASHDPIASPEQPFLGDFVLQGSLCAVAPASAYAAYFYSNYTAICAFAGYRAIQAKSFSFPGLDSIGIQVDSQNIAISAYAPKVAINAYSSQNAISAYSLQRGAYIGGNDKGAEITGGNIGIEVYSSKKAISAYGITTGAEIGSSGIAISAYSPKIAIKAISSNKKQNEDGIRALDVDGYSYFDGDVTISGNLTAFGELTYLDTKVQITSSLYVRNTGTDTALTVIQTGNTNVAVFYDDENPALIIEDGGNVGIGLLNPDANLHVADIRNDSNPEIRIQAVTNNTYDPTLRLIGTGSTSDGLTVRYDSNVGDVYINNGATPSNSIAYRVSTQADTDSVVVFNTGNVGINATAPINAAKLNIAGDSDSSNIALSANASFIAGSFHSTNMGLSAFGGSVGASIRSPNLALRVTGPVQINENPEQENPLTTYAVNINRGTSTGAVSIGNATGNLTLNGNAGTLTTAGTLGITTGNTLSINTTTGRATNINTGTGAVTTTIGNAGTVDINGATLTLDSTTSTSINATAGAATTNIGTGTTTGKITIGNTSLTGGVELDGSPIDINVNAGAYATNIGTGSTTGAVSIGNASGNLTLNGNAGTLTTAGTLEITTGNTLSINTTTGRATNINSGTNAATNINTGGTNSTATNIHTGSNSGALGLGNSTGNTNIAAATLDATTASAVNINTTTGRATNINSGTNAATNINTGGTNSTATNIHTGSNSGALGLGNTSGATNITGSTVTVTGPTNIANTTNAAVNINTGSGNAATNIATTANTGPLSLGNTSGITNIHGSVIALVAANTHITGTLSASNFRTPNSTSIGAGTNALFNITSGTGNTAFGAKTLQFNLTGSNNCAFGEEALIRATGSNNCAFGVNSLRSNLNTASDNTGFGHGSLLANSTGTDNAAFGRSAAESITEGSRNTAVGAYALSNLQTGNNNVGIGRSVASSSTSVSNEVTIGNGTVVARFQGAASAWTFTSDARDKSDIENLELGLDFINQLQPRKFKWAIRNSDVDQGKEAAGFIAQEVLSVTQANQAEYLGLVDTNDPNHFTLGQTSLIPVLVNAIKELKAEIEILKAR